jgi:hypothetical protein
VRVPNTHTVAARSGGPNSTGKESTHGHSEEGHPGHSQEDTGDPYLEEVHDGR